MSGAEGAQISREAQNQGAGRVAKRRGTGWVSRAAMRSPVGTACPPGSAATQFSGPGHGTTDAARHSPRDGVLRPALFKAYRPDLTPVRQETKSHAESGMNGPFINVGRWSGRMKVRARDVLDRILVENRRDSSDSFARSVVLPRQQPGSTGIRQ
ncbi:hypothetical protein CCP4SC76_1070002 [Gammaproteobacteria bacterium]